ncbi:MAG: hypothetical protein ABSH44_11320 [Bryobacteraceae bacterium]|jgi:hypothetical protein
MGTNHKGFKKLAANGTANVLVADTVTAMLRRMSIPGPQENTERGSSDDPQRDGGRLIGLALWRERRHTEKLLNGLLVAIKAEIGLAEERTLAKLEDIDTSVGLIAGELARRNSNPPSNGTAS